MSANHVAPWRAARSPSTEGHAVELHSTLPLAVGGTAPAAGGGVGDVATLVGNGAADDGAAEEAAAAASPTSFCLCDMRSITAALSTLI